MKDVKALLKEAREATKNKNYDAVLKISKSILREDKTNYMALVFLGLALQEVGPVDQACKAFQKAIEHNPTNPLAWNGLAMYYEKLESDEAKSKLVETYFLALKVETNPKKILEYCEKLCKVSDNKDIVKITNFIFEFSTKLESDSTKLYEILAKFCQTLKDVPNELLTVFEKCFCELLKLRDYRSVEYFSSYINLLYQQNKYEEVFNNAEKMHSYFERDTVSLVWMCKIYNQLFVERSDLANKFIVQIKEYFPKLLLLEPKNATGLFTKGIQLFLDNELACSKDILSEVCTLRPGLVHAWVFLVEICVKLNIIDEAMQAYLSAAKLLTSTKYVNIVLNNILTKFHLEILSKSNNECDWNQAVEIYKNSDEDLKNENLENIILVLINLKNISEVLSLLESLKNKNELKARFLEAKLYKQQEKFDEALKILEKDTPEMSDWFMEIGIIYWILKDYKKSLLPFLKATKCDPNNYICFINLGNYYNQIENFDKARRCYEKAFNLNKQSQQVVEELSNIYNKLKKWDTAQNLLETITVGPINEKNSWAWLQLALSYLEQENYSKAIEKLQFVVRIEQENTYCWQCLADAYFARGSYTSALKCYVKSLEFTKNTLYPSLQIANIKKTIGLYDEASIEFKEIIANNQQYLPALKGLAETCMCQARECNQDQRLGSARNHAQSALNYLTLAIEQKNYFSCLWKLIADTCIFVTNFPEKYCYLEVTQELVEGKTTIEREDLFSLATSCYCKAISLTENNNLIWHDLSTCYLKHAVYTTNQNDKDMLLSYAMTSAKYCATSNPKKWQHWNLLGNIAMEESPPDYALAQHYFIKAVTIENNNPIAWGNLGILYFILGDIKLANKAFAQGQRSDPNYVNNWIGQALIAESMGVEEAMDLFRHSVQLGHHQQGAIGYGHWVCQTLLEAPQKTISYSIEGMHAIPVACDAMTWYTEKNSDDGCAWTMLGMLKERLGLNLGSLEAFKKAYDSSNNHRDLTRVNYGRLLSKHEKYVQAINIFQEVEAATFSSGSGLALALFKSQHYEESYAAYDQALHWLTEEQSHQSELLVALASMAYMFQGLEGAKTLLFQSIQLKPPSPWGLYATLALGLIHKDLELAELVLKELEPLKDNAECLPHYALLLCSKLLREEKPDVAVKEISKLVHRHPENASVWLVLSMTILRVKSERKRALPAVKCAQVALKTGQSNMDITKILGYISLGYLLAGDVKRVLISAQKAIHCYPDLADGWAALLAVLVKDKERCSKEFMLNVFEHVSNLKPSDLIINWLKKIRKTLA